MSNNSIRFIISGFGLGFAPFAPGTFGTLLGIPLAFGLSFLTPLGYMAGVVLLIGLSIFLCELYERRTQAQASEQHDASYIVIDEVVGYLVAVTWLPLTWQSFLAAFIIFRILDATKPFPISIVDAKVKGGLGVVADDLLAGVLTNIILQVVYTYTTVLG